MKRGAEVCDGLRAGRRGRRIRCRARALRCVVALPDARSYPHRHLCPRCVAELRAADRVQLERALLECRPGPAWTIPTPRP